MTNSTYFHHLIDIRARRTYPAEITVRAGRIARVRPTQQPVVGYALPGFVDAHVHIESSMLTPVQFARLATVHGTVAAVSDPHEIGNVLGVAGVEYMLENARQTPFKFAFGAPSCVPATPFETAGATIGVSDIEKLLQRPDVPYLAEMMNWPGVLARDKEVIAKIAVAQKLGKPVDGHAPGLRGDDARRYAAGGMSTDHECFTIEEARDKLACGMHILIREGSAARNFDALIDLLSEAPERIMFCSDDKHPDGLVEGHIDALVRRALARGHDPYDVWRAACLNPIQHYGLSVGMLREGDSADFIVIDDPARVNVLRTYLGGTLAAVAGKALLPDRASVVVNQFEGQLISADALRVPNAGPALRVIVPEDGQLVTASERFVHGQQEPWVVADPVADVLKIVVCNRYATTPPAAAFVKNFGLKRGALASTVAHDSHNVVAVGVSDEALAQAINALMEARGGIAVAEEGVELLPLPVAGLMSGEDGYAVAARYAALDKRAKELGATLEAPFMTLSFMALLVIPALKLSDKGLFDGEKFAFTDVVIN